MSVDFSVSDAPTKRVPCESCAIVAQHPDWPEHEEWGGKCWEHCDGTTEVSVAPTANMANGNAMPVLRLVGLPAEEWGSIEASEVSNVLQRVNAIIARGDERGLARPSSEGGGDRKMVVNEDGMAEIRTTCRWVDCGSPDWIWTHRLESLREVLSWAARNGKGVHWG